MPVAPSTPDAVTTALRSDGTTGQPAPGDAGPPRTGALSLAAILAIALAAFEGIQTWVQESGPRRAQADAHRRELELLAAKAGAAGAGHRAEAAGIRSRTGGAGRGVQSSHDYGRGALGRGSGGRGRGGSGAGPGGSRGSVSGLHSGSGRAGGPSGGRGPSGSGTTPSGRRRDGSGSGSGGFFGRSGGPGAGSGSGGRRGGSGSGGHRSPRQAVRDWWTRKNNNGKTGPGSAGPRPGGMSGTTPGTKNATTNRGRTPTFWSAVGETADRRWRARRAGSTPPGGPNRQTARDIKGPSGNAGSSTATKPGGPGRTTFWGAVHETLSGRWENRRASWKTKPPPPTGKTPGSSAGPTSAGPAAGPPPHSGGATGDASQEWLYREFLWRMGMGRSSPFDVRPDTVAYRVDQVDPPGTHAKRWEPTPIAPARVALPRTGPPALPRAPQRPAGSRPGTTRRKDPIPMPAADSGAMTPLTTVAAVPAASQHLTEVTLDDVLRVLTALTTDGMDTYDDAVELVRRSRLLLADLEELTEDLARTHNVSGPRTRQAMVGLMESVSLMVGTVERLSRAALEAAERSETEETALARDYRPTQHATADAGLATPSARIHNEN